ncbi:MAG: ABC transporter ATP-binding protein/permease [Lachnospiraceae bacterium]|jgi:ABC-type multidrug transport system fused ATPase/permease subunit|nr:ABC transporter ATP-binding protein/permease [Lachnospiraceae bacterium]
MIPILKKLQVLLSRRQKWHMGLLSIMMVIGAFLQVAGVSLIVQAMTMVMDVTAISQEGLVKDIYELLGGGSQKRFTILVLLALVAVILLKNFFLYIQQKLTLSFVYTNQFSTSERMMKNYLRRDYEFFLNADTAIVQRSITSDVNNMFALILALLSLLSDCIVFVFLTVYCFMQDPILTVLLASVLILLLVVIKKVLKPIMYKAGEDNQMYYSGLFKWISQTVQGIKEVKIAGKEAYFVREYAKCGRGYVEAVQKYSLYNNIPKLLIECVCVVCMVGYILFMVFNNVSPDAMTTSIATFAAAALILLPCVNRINNQITSIAYFEPFFMGVSNNLQDEINAENTDFTFAAKQERRLPLRDKIEMRSITYAYPNTEKLIFDQANLTIPVGKSVGIVGMSGAGKSTVVDILLGLLKPQEGSLYADGVDIMLHYREWIQNIGYIPQMIFMLDDTIRKNVAFGVPNEEASEEKIWRALREAKLDDFVRSLPNGLETGIGERGIRLSGGQRQRIGIARALYHDPEVMVLDEATSALDHDTETAIMDSINQLHGKKTLIIIAHRLETIKNCDLVYRVNDGKVQVERADGSKI